MRHIVEAREYYPDVSVLPDSVLIAKVLILSAKLYNLCWAAEPRNQANILDTAESLRFYVAELCKRYDTSPPSNKHSEYNEPFRVISVLTVRDVAALILSKALRLHSIFHHTGAVHLDSVADLAGYISLFSAIYSRAS